MLPRFRHDRFPAGRLPNTYRRLRVKKISSTHGRADPSNALSPNMVAEMLRSTAGMGIDTPHVGERLATPPCPPIPAPSAPRLNATSARPSRHSASVLVPSPPPQIRLTGFWGGTGCRHRTLHRAVAPRPGHRDRLGDLPRPTTLTQTTHRVFWHSQRPGIRSELRMRAADGKGRRFDPPVNTQPPAAVLVPRRTAPPERRGRRR